MKKRKTGRIFSRPAGQRRLLLKSLARELVLRERIETTEAKAKETAPFVEKLVTKAKKGDLPARRHLRKFFDEETTKKLIEEIAPRYKDRSGGYTRITKLGPRRSDGASMAAAEFVQ